MKATDDLQKLLRLDTPGNEHEETDHEGTIDKAMQRMWRYQMDWSDVDQLMHLAYLQ